MATIITTLFVPDIEALNKSIMAKIRKVYRKYRLPNYSTNRNALMLQLGWLLQELGDQQIVMRYKISFDLVQSTDAPINILVEYELGDGSIHKFRSTAH